MAIKEVLPLLSRQCHDPTQNKINDNYCQLRRGINTGLSRTFRRVAGLAMVTTPAAITLMRAVMLRSMAEIEGKPAI